MRKCGKSRLRDFLETRESMISLYVPESMTSGFLDLPEVRNINIPELPENLKNYNVIILLGSS